MSAHFPSPDGQTPQGVYLLDPATGLPTAPGGGGGGTDVVWDTSGQPFSLASCAHAYGYTNGLLTTDTATLGSLSWVKTYFYSGGVLTAETGWVRQ